MGCESDVFPTHFSPVLKKLVVPHVDQLFHFTPFVPRLVNGTIIFHLLPTRNSEKNVEHVGYILQTATKTLENVKEVPWGSASKRLNRLSQRSKNADVAMAFCIRKNTFLVKKFFTFGLRTTDAGVCHVYQTGSMPLLFYTPDMPDSDAERTFSKEGQRHFNCYRLEPNSEYMVGENTSYLIMTVEKTLFAVDVFHLSSVEPSRYKNPTEKPIRLVGKRKYDNNDEEVSSRRRRRETDGRATYHENDGSTNQAAEEASSVRSQIEDSHSGDPPEGVSSHSFKLNSRDNSVDQSSFQKRVLNRSHPVSEPEEPIPPLSELEESLAPLSEPEESLAPLSEPEEQPASDAESDGQPLADNDPGDQSDGSEQHATRSVLSSVAEGVAGPSSSATHSTSSKNTQNAALPSHSRSFASSTPKKPSNRQNQPLSPKDTARNMNSSSLTEPYSAPADEPTPYEEKDEYGNTYRYTPIDLNWSENENRPITVQPFMKYSKGKCFLYVPIKQ